MFSFFKPFVSTLYSPSTERAIVRRAWSWGVRVALVLILINILCGVGLWFYAWYVPTTPSDNEVSAEVLNEALLSDMSERMVRRAFLFESLGGNTPSHVDRGETAQ